MTIHDLSGAMNALAAAELREVAVHIDGYDDHGDALREQEANIARFLSDEPERTDEEGRTYRTPGLPADNLDEALRQFRPPSPAIIKRQAYRTGCMYSALVPTIEGHTEKRPGYYMPATHVLFEYKTHQTLITRAGEGYNPMVPFEHLGSAAREAQQDQDRFVYCTVSELVDGEWEKLAGGVVLRCRRVDWTNESTEWGDGAHTAADGHAWRAGRYDVVGYARLPESHCNAIWRIIAEHNREQFTPELASEAEDLELAVADLADDGYDY